MKTTLNRDVKLRLGLTDILWPKGSEITVTIPFHKNRPEEPMFTLAQIHHIDTKQEIIVKSEKLYTYSDDFVIITEDMVAEAMMDGKCPSLTGADVEPDGKDPHGFPSILLALGLA